MKLFNPSEITFWSVTEGHFMRRVGWRIFGFLVALFGWEAVAYPSSLLAQIPNNQQKFNDAVRQAQWVEWTSYICVGAGILLVVLGIPLSHDARG